MKRLIPFLLAFASVCGAQALVGTPVVITSTGAYSYTVVSTSDIVLVIQMNAAGDTYPTGPTATGWTFTHAFTADINTGSLYGNAWWAKPPATGAVSITVSDHFADSEHGVICEFSGMQTTTPQDGSGVGNHATSTNPASTGVTTTATDLLIGMVIGPSNASPGTGYTAITTLGSLCSTAGPCFEYKTTVAAGTPAPAFTASSSTWLVGAFAIKQLASSSSRHRGAVL